MPTPSLTYTLTVTPTPSAGVTGGVLPLAVHARVSISAATDETGGSVAFPERAFHFEWDFGDDAVGDAVEETIDPVQNLRVSANKRQIGVQAAYVYTRPGDFTLRVRPYFWDASAGQWVELTAQSVTVQARSQATAADAADWDTFYFDPNSTAATALGLIDAPFKTLAQLRAVVDRATKTVVYLANGSVWQPAADEDVLVLKDVSGLRILPYLPGGSTDNTPPVLRHYASSSGRSVLAVCPSSASNAQNEIQRLVINASAGTFTVTFKGQTTSALAYDASASTIQTAIRALSTVGGSNVNVTADAPGFLIEFVSSLASASQPMMTIGRGGLTETARSYLIRTQPGSANTSKVEDVLVSGVTLDAYGAAASKCLLVSPVVGVEGWADRIAFRDVRMTGALSSTAVVDNLLASDGTNGPRNIAFVRCKFEHDRPSSGGDNVRIACLSNAALIGCVFRGGDGDQGADSHLLLAQFSATLASAYALVRWCAFQGAAKKNACVRIPAGWTDVTLRGCNMTAARHGVIADKTGNDAVTHPKRVYVEGNAVHGMGLAASDRAVGVFLRFATLVLVRNNLFWENGYDQSTAVGSDVHIDDAQGAEEGASDTGPIVIEHNSFYRSWGFAGSPCLLVDDYRYLQLYNNAMVSLGSPNGSNPNRSLVRVTDVAYMQSARFAADGNLYHAPNMSRGNVIKPFAIGGSSFFEFKDSSNNGWVTRGQSTGTPVYDVHGAHANPAFRNPASGNFRFLLTDAPVDFCASSHRRVRHDYRGALRTPVPDCGAYEFDAATSGAYAYDPAPLPALPAADGWNFSGGDVQYIQPDEPVLATNVPATDVDNRPHHNLAHRDNVLATTLTSLLGDINSAFCSPPQPGSAFGGPHTSILSFISIGHNPDGTLKLSAADLANLGFLRIDGTNQMLADLNVGDNRVVNVRAAQRPTDAPPLAQVVQRAGDTVQGTITFDGPTGQTLNLGGHRVTNVAAAQDASDAPPVSQVVRRAGDSMSGTLAMTGPSTQVIDMGGHRAVNLGSATAAGDAPRADQCLLLASGGNVVGAVSLSGGLSMAGQRIVSMADGAGATDAATFGQVLLRSGANSMTGTLNANGNRIDNLAAASFNSNSAPRFAQCISVEFSDVKRSLLTFQQHTWSPGGTTYTPHSSAPVNGTGYGINMSAAPDSYLNPAATPYFDGRFIIDHTTGNKLNTNPIDQSSGNAIYNLAYPTKGHDAANKKYVDDQTNVSFDATVGSATVDAENGLVSVPAKMPAAQTGVKAGRWLLTFYGTLALVADNAAPFEVALRFRTTNGTTTNSATFRLYIDNYPDGSAPCSGAVILRVPDAGDGTGSVLQVDSITGLHRVHRVIGVWLGP